APPLTIYQPKKRGGEIPNHPAIRQHDRQSAIGSRPIIQQRVIVAIRLEHRLERVVRRNRHRGCWRLGQSSRTSGEPRQRDQKATSLKRVPRKRIQERKSSRGL